MGWQNSSPIANYRVGVASRRVLFLINKLDAGGAERQMITFAKGLTLHGFDCKVIVFRSGSGPGALAGLVDEARDMGVRIFVPTKIGDWVPELANLLSNFYLSPPIVWTWGYRADLLKLIAWPLLRPRATVVSLRSAYAEKIYAWRWLWQFIDQQSDAYISNSELNARFVTEVAPMARGKIQVIHNGVDARLFEVPVQLPEKISELRVVMLGNIRIHAKGYDLVVELAQRVREAQLPVRFTIGGADFAQGALGRMIAEFDLQDLVQLAGPVLDAREFLDGGHVFLLMSRYEGQPNALFEAMAVGLPCVATRVGDISCLTIDNLHLKQIAIGSPEQAYEALVALLHDWNAARRMGEQARTLCREKFGIAKMISSATETIESVLGVDELVI